MSGAEQWALLALWLTGAVVALGVLGLTLYAEVDRRRRLPVDNVVEYERVGR